VFQSLHNQPLNITERLTKLGLHAHSRDVNQIKIASQILMYTSKIRAD